LLLGLHNIDFVLARLFFDFGLFQFEFFSLFTHPLESTFFVDKVNSFLALLSKNSICWESRYDAAASGDTSVRLAIVLAERCELGQCQLDNRVKVIAWWASYQVDQESSQCVANELVYGQLRKVVRNEAFLLLGVSGGANIRDAAKVSKLLLFSMDLWL